MSKTRCPICGSGDVHVIGEILPDGEKFFARCFSCEWESDAVDTKAEAAALYGYKGTSITELQNELGKAQSANAWMRHIVQKLERENAELKTKLSLALQTHAEMCERAEKLERENDDI